MPSWEFALALDRAGRTPLFVQVARGIADDIRRGRLRPGDALPGTRRLAGALRLHRNTVLAAYDELQAEGWIRSAAARGTFVSTSLPEPDPRGFSPRGSRRKTVPDRVGYDLRAAPPAPDFPPLDGISFGTGAPDVRLIPVAALSRAYRRALARGSGRLLDYGTPHGVPELRAALAEMLTATRGLAAGADDVLITRGSQMALALIARALISAGDVVVVESLGYRAAWQAFAAAGARLVALPVDESGLRVDRLRELARRQPPRAVYLTPHHHFPTMVTLAPGRRLELLALAREHRFAVVEDDYDHEFHYEGHPVLPLASVDRAGVVIYVGTLSKVLAPGVRIGYVVAPASLLSRLVAQRAALDTQGDPAVESAVAELMQDGELARHVRRVRRVYRARRDALAGLLRRSLGDAVSFRVPPGGAALWVRAHGIDVDAWSARARAGGLHFHAGRHFAFDGRSRPFVRLGFAALNEAELAGAVERLAAAVPC